MLELVFIRLEIDDKRGADVNVLTSSVTPEGCTGEQPLPGAYRAAGVRDGQHKGGTAPRCPSVAHGIVLPSSTREQGSDGDAMPRTRQERCPASHSLSRGGGSSAGCSPCASSFTHVDLGQTPAYSFLSWQKRRGVRSGCFQRENKAKWRPSISVPSRGRAAEE